MMNWSCYPYSAFKRCRQRLTAQLFLRRRDANSMAYKTTPQSGPCLCMADGECLFSLVKTWMSFPGESCVIKAAIWRIFFSPLCCLPFLWPFLAASSSSCQWKGLDSPNDVFWWLQFKIGCKRIRNKWTFPFCTSLFFWLLNHYRTSCYFT